MAPLTNNRRDFLKKLTGITATLMVPFPTMSAGLHPLMDPIGPVLPLRRLGKTGEKVTMLGLGGYHIGWTSEKNAQETIEAAIEGGIRFFDNAEAYDGGGSESRYGKYLTPKYRDNIFLMTKTQAKDHKQAQKDLEESLKRLNTDTIDLWQMHSMFAPEDVDRRLENKVLDVLVEAKKTGKVRYIGFTGHQNPYTHARMLDKAGEDIFDTVQFPVNPLDAAYKASFITEIMDRLVNNNVGMLAMKTLADGRFFSKKQMNDREVWSTESPVVPDRITIQEALNFAWSLPVSVLITGAENAMLIREKVTMAKNFTSLSDSQRQSLVEKVSDLAAAGEVEYYKNV